LKTGKSAKSANEFIGYNFSCSSAIITEFLENDTIAEAIFDRRPEFTPLARCKTIFGVACAMLHLHLHAHDRPDRFLSTHTVRFDSRWEPQVLNGSQIQIVSITAYLSAVGTRDKEYPPWRS
jgi:hypothetical protein